MEVLELSYLELRICLTPSEEHCILLVSAVAGVAKMWIRSPPAECRCFGASAEAAANRRKYRPMVELRNELSLDPQIERRKDRFSASYLWEMGWFLWSPRSAVATAGVVVLPAVPERKGAGTQKLAAGKILVPAEVRLVGNPEAEDILGKNTEAGVRRPERLEQKPLDHHSTPNTPLQHEPIRTAPS